MECVRVRSLELAIASLRNQRLLDEIAKSERQLLRELRGVGVASTYVGYLLLAVPACSTQLQRLLMDGGWIALANISGKPKRTTQRQMINWPRGELTTEPVG